MNTTKFTASFTFSTESIIGFAKFLGYKETIPEPVYNEDGTVKLYEEVPNTQTALDYVKEKALTHIQLFVTGWADKLVQDGLNEAIQQTTDEVKPQLEDAILKPVKEAIQVTYETN
jgi:hypothetical protein